MVGPRRTTAGGAPIALGAIGGAFFGFLAGQTTLGFLLGIGAGITLAVLIWWRER